MAKSIAKTLNTEAAELYDDLLHALRRLAKHLGEDTGDAVAQSASAMMHNLADLAGQAVDQSRDLARKAGEEVRRHPVTTAAIAAAAVAAVGVGVLAVQRARDKA